MHAFTLAKGVASGTFHSGDGELCSEHRKEVKPQDAHVNE